MTYSEQLEAALERHNRLKYAESDIDSAAYELRQAGEKKLSMMAEMLMHRVTNAMDADAELIEQLTYKAKAERETQTALDNRLYEGSV